MNGVVRKNSRALRREFAVMTLLAAGVLLIHWRGLDNFFMETDPGWILGLDFSYPTRFIQRLLLSYPFHDLFGLNPALYRAVNLIVHTLNAYLLYRLMFALSEDRFVGFLAGILFVAYDNAGAVLWISCLCYLLAVSFALLCLLCILRYLQSGRRNAWGLTIVFYALAILSQENTIPLFAILFIFEISFRLSRRMSVDTVGMTFRYAPLVLLSIIAIGIHLRIAAERGWDRDLISLISVGLDPQTLLGFVHALIDPIVPNNTGPLVADVFDGLPGLFLIPAVPILAIFVYRLA
ncbi:hypothetical protein ACFL4G_13220, partial [Thermodesulfobacteriota bacterium]